MDNVKLLEKLIEIEARAGNIRQSSLREFVCEGLTEIMAELSIINAFHGHFPDLVTHLNAVRDASDMSIAKDLGFWRKVAGEASAALSAMPDMRNCIALSKAELQSGHSRVKRAEGLIKQLPSTHDGRNSWLLNYGVGKEAKSIRAARAERDAETGEKPGVFHKVMSVSNHEFKEGDTFTFDTAKQNTAEPISSEEIMQRIEDLDDAPDDEDAGDKIAGEIGDFFMHMHDSQLFDDDFRRFLLNSGLFELCKEAAGQLRNNANQSRLITKLRTRVEELEQVCETLRQEQPAPGEGALTIERAREIAAQCWCDDENSGTEMDVVLAESFADRLVKYSSPRDNIVQRIRDGAEVEDQFGTRYGYIELFEARHLMTRMHASGWRHMEEGEPYVFLSQLLKGCVKEYVAPPVTDKRVPPYNEVANIFRKSATAKDVERLFEEWRIENPEETEKGQSSE